MKGRAYVNFEQILVPEQRHAASRASDREPLSRPPELVFKIRNVCIEPWNGAVRVAAAVLYTCILNARRT